jgi:hypothetical protein
MARLTWAFRGVPLFAVLALFAGDPIYRSVSVDKSGQLHIVLDSGKEILPKKTSGQTSFGVPLISPDDHTVGWLEEFADPGYGSYFREISVTLVIYRAGHVLHRFRADQVLWDWDFRDDGKQVAYSSGPTHGGAAECVLRDVESGRIVAHWWVKSASEPPSWALGLNQ